MSPDCIASMTLTAIFTLSGKGEGLLTFNCWNRAYLTFAVLSSKLIRYDIPLTTSVR